MEIIMKKIRTAVIGVGYLGKFHAAKYATLAESELVGVCDSSSVQGQAIAAQHHTKFFPSYQELIGQVDAVSIATPTAQHFEIARYFLKNKVHVLVEKPMTITIAEADELIAVAKENGVKLQVGHLERFNPALRALSNGILQKVEFIESHRLAAFKPRGTDVNVIFDLMIHDIEIIQHICRSPITHIDAKGLSVLSGSVDIANARVSFANGCVANVTASRVSLKAERKLRLFQADAYISVDLQEYTLSISRKGEQELYPGIPNIETHTQTFDEKDSLKLQIIAFLQAIRDDSRPVVSGEDGRDALLTALQISNMISDSIKES